MSTGKPQQAAGQTDNSSDDLIAELARLMASDAKSEKAAPPPSPEPAPRPQPAAAGTPAPGTFRIPGMTEPPLSVPAPNPAPTQAEAPQVRAPEAPPVAAPVADRQPAPTRVEPSLGEMPRVASPMPAFAHLATPSPSASKPITTPRVNIAIDPDKKGPGGNPVIEPFKFDFGVVGATTPAAAEPKVEAPVAASTSRPFRIPGDEAPAPQQAHAPEDPPSDNNQDEPQPEAKTSEADEDDPIADLIAAELKNADAPAEGSAQEGGFVLRPAAAVSRPVTTPVAPRPATPVPAPTSGQTVNPIASSFQPSRQQAPESKPQQAPARDNFGTPPVFGLGNKPAQPDDQKIGTDPIDEIEDLIGEAVRVELSAPPRQAGSLAAATPNTGPVTKPLPPVAQQAPVVPPLNAGFAPRRAGIKDKPTDEEVHAAAEEAILAAAAATGAEVGRLRNVERDRTEKVQAEKRSAAPRKAMNMRPLVGLAVAGTLLLAAGFGLYWVLGMGHNDAEAPVLAADTTPVKEAPPPAATDSDAPRSVVMDEISGVTSDQGEQLVSRDQTADEAVTAPPPATDADAGLANRKVRTVTVRPDGTIVSSDDAVAGATQLPVDRPNVPAMPAATLSGSDLLQGTPGAETATPDPIGAMVAASDPTAVQPITADPATEPASTAVIDPTLVAPTPAPRIVDRAAAAARQVASQPTNPVNAVVDGAGAQTVDLLGNNQQQAAIPQAAPTQTSGAVDAPAYVQLSSQRSEAEAQAAAQNIIRRFGGLFGGQQLEIRRVDLGAKGIYYRVRLPANSLQDASQLCNSVKANGGDCFAVNG